MPKYGFVSVSEVFSGMFDLPPDTTNGGSQDGETDGRPLVLENVKKDSFLAFLKLLYPQMLFR